MKYMYTSQVQPLQMKRYEPNSNFIHFNLFLLENIPNYKMTPYIYIGPLYIYWVLTLAFMLRFVFLVLYMRIQIVTKRILDVFPRMFMNQIIVFFQNIIIYIER